MRVLFLSVAWVVACGPPAPVLEPLPPPPAETIPVELTEDAFRSTGTTVTRLGVGASHFEDLTPSVRHTGGPRLVVVEGHRTLGGYVADALLVASSSGVGSRAIWFVNTRCTGAATFADRAWTIALEGGPACTRWNGVFRGAERAARTPPPLPPIAALDVVLPPPTTPYAQALIGLDTLLPGELPCPIVLRARAEEGPGGLPERPGETFELVRARNGQVLPSEPHTEQRYEVLYVRTEHVEPVVDAEAHAFTAGIARGRAYLIDVPAARIVCVADVRATNGDSIDGRSGDEARMWLQFELLFAEERAAALGMRAPAD